MIKSSGETYIFLLLLVCAGNCWANDVNLFGVRPAISQTGSITDAIDYNFFISTRVNLADVTVNGVENPVRDMLFYAQPSIVYKYSPQLSFAASYVFQRTNPFDREFSNEHRVFQQTVYSVPVFTGNFYQRARF
ncbi:hypothetical protein, partial [Nitrosomonas sp.]|uniref:hypothetical protein n=1 Tax=Nitrosomonas sp. TaxID=42353 RepID=UPI0035B3830F